MFIYKQTEFLSRDGADLWTVGHMEGNKFEPESDHSSKYAAAARVIELNGGGPKYIERHTQPTKDGKYRVGMDPIPGEVDSNNPHIAGKAQHTPGPWKIEIFRRPTYVGGEALAVSYEDKERSITICDLHSRHIQRTGRPVEINNEKEANARLIAAAPELLEALKAILPYAENESASLDEAAKRDGENSEIADEARKAWAAIDQALELIKATEGQQS